MIHLATCRNFEGIQESRVCFCVLLAYLGMKRSTWAFRITWCLLFICFNILLQTTSLRNCKAAFSKSFLRCLLGDEPNSFKSCSLIKAVTVRQLIKFPYVAAWKKFESPLFETSGQILKYFHTSINSDHPPIASFDTTPNQNMTVIVQL